MIVFVVVVVGVFNRQHNSLIEYNTRLMEAFQLYNSLMTELPSYGYVAASNPAPSQPSNVSLLISEYLVEY